MDIMHILSQKEAIWNTIFSIFERLWGHPNVAGPGKTPPPPLDGPVFNSWKYLGILLMLLENLIVN